MHMKCFCGARLKVSEAMRGRKSKCPRCGRTFRVPPAEREPVVAQIKEGYAVEDAVGVTSRNGS